MKTIISGLHAIGSARCFTGRKFYIPFLLGLALLALTALTACQEEPVPPMRIGANVWPGYEPLFLARQQGQLSEQDFRLVEFSDCPGIGRAFRNRTIEAACITLDEAFYLVSDGMDPVILFVMDQSNGADALLARKEIKSLAELKGKRIGVEVGAVGTYMLTRGLQQAGLTVKDVTPVYLAIEKQVDEFQAGTVDAVVTYEPFRTRLRAMGAVDLFNSSKIPGEIVDVLVVRRDYLAGHPGRGIALRKAWFAAVEQIRRSPHESSRLMAVREKSTTEEFEASMLGLHLPDEAECRALIGGDAPNLMKSAEQLKTVMRDASLIQKDIALKPLFTPPDTLKPAP